LSISKFNDMVDASLGPERPAWTRRSDCSQPSPTRPASPSCASSPRTPRPAPATSRPVATLVSRPSRITCACSGKRGWSPPSAADSRSGTGLRPRRLSALARWLGAWCPVASSRSMISSHVVRPPAAPRLPPLWRLGTPADSPDTGGARTVGSAAGDGRLASWMLIRPVERLSGIGDTLQTVVATQHPTPEPGRIERLDRIARVPVTVSRRTGRRMPQSRRSGS